VILVDSDRIIDGLSGRSAAIELLESVSQHGLAISAVTVGEVFEGAYLRPAPGVALARYWQFLDGYEVFPVTAEIADTFAHVRADLCRAGNLIPDLDLLIASTAIVHDLTLLTRNQRHFARVPGLRLYDDGQRNFGTTPVS
jgi:tRNA(fMet)-specific endonuclease VapC